MRQYIEWVEERHEPRPQRAIDWKLAPVSGSELFDGLSVRETAELVTLSPGSPISPLEHTAPGLSSPHTAPPAMSATDGEMSGRRRTCLRPTSTASSRRRRCATRPPPFP